MNQENARIFREMQASDQIRADMKNSIKARALEHLNRDSFGALQQSGIKSALDDIYRRCFENAWFNKDLFDGRWHADNKAARGEGEHTWPSRGDGYDHRQAFYGMEAQQGPQQEPAQDRERDRGDEMER